MNYYNYCSILISEGGDKVNWLQELLEENNMSRYRLSKLTGIFESQLASIVNNDIKKEDVKYGHVIAIEEVFNGSVALQYKLLDDFKGVNKTVKVVSWELGDGDLPNAHKGMWLKVTTKDHNWLHVYYNKETMNVEWY